MNGEKNNRYRSFLCLLLAILICTSTVSCQKKKNSTFSLETAPYITEQQVNPVHNLTIYTYNEKNSRLESRVVALTTYTDQTRAETALNYLLSTPDFEFALNSYDIPDYTLTVAGNIATVRITNEYKDEGNNPQKRYALHFCIVNTLCVIDGINYVSVYAGDSEMGGSKYIGPSSFLENNVSNQYAEYSSGVSTSSHQSVALYYGEMSQSYIVPEQQHIYINTDDRQSAVYTIINELSDTPVNSNDLFAPVHTNTDINTFAVNDNTMVIDLTQNPCSSLVDNELITYGAIYHSITSIYPEITDMAITVNGKPITIYDREISILNYDTFPDIIGTAVTLYMALSTMDSLYPVNMYLSVSSGISLTQIIDALIAGPPDHNRGRLMSPIFGGITTSNLISARVVNEVAIVNFDTSFFNAVRSMSKAEETIMIYAIVNTLTAREQIDKVQFLINNQSFETIKGHIYYKNPLYANPGLAFS